MATWWICRGRLLQDHPLLPLRLRPQRDGSLQEPAARLRLRDLLRFRAVSSAPSPVWSKVHRWPKMSQPPLTPSLRPQLLKEPPREAVSRPNLLYANPRSSWSSTISTQTGEWTGQVKCVKIYSYTQQNQSKFLSQCKKLRYQLHNMQEAWYEKDRMLIFHLRFYESKWINQGLGMRKEEKRTGTKLALLVSDICFSFF